MNFTSNHPVDKVLATWKNEPSIRECVTYWHLDPVTRGSYAPMPEDLHPELSRMLRRKGIESLYIHQKACWDVTTRGENPVVVTGTASGKSLCYHLPILDACLRSTATRALCLYPTKALAQDQLKVLTNYQHSLQQENPKSLVVSSIYDGDTPTHLRGAIRSKANIILTNPDMLHLSILPHHTVWAEFFRQLRYIVIDEMHVYRGVFGSHLANIIRRLTRIARFYGSSPIFILTSATIANPVELAAKLIEKPVACVDLDGSPRGERNFLFYNPPFIQKELGIRRSASGEAIRLTGDLLAYDVQTIIFTRARRSVEMLLRNLRYQTGKDHNQVRGYRSGYLSSERRKIEHELRSGEAQAVVATNALELGIDIGNLDASILVGYPGSIASTRQQAGRAGRRNASSLAIFVASSSPLDQYLIKHPEHILGRTPEMALIDPNNVLIMLQHLRCALFELPFNEGEDFGTVPRDFLTEIFSLLQTSGELHQANGKYYWTADEYPANQVSLRTTSAERVKLQTLAQTGLVTIGEIDQPSSLWMVHPGAIYLHAGDSYQVVELDLEQHAALLNPIESDFYTEAIRKTEIQTLQEFNQLDVNGGIKHYGDVLVKTQTVGFRQIRWHNNEVISQDSLDLPITELRTTAYWLVLSDAIVDKLREKGMWVNDPINYGTDWVRQKNLARKRDLFTCQICGKPEAGEAHHVHHKIPFRSFTSYLLANQLDNLVTLCPSCHKKAEEAVRMRSGLAGLAFLLHHLAPLYIMCDITDLGVSFDPQSAMTEGLPSVCIYDQIPAGIGLSKRLFEMQQDVLTNALELVHSCPCENGCPGCVGPAGENGEGGKEETKALLISLLGLDDHGITLG